MLLVEKRNRFWDILRGIAMLLVVIGHANLNYDKLLFCIIYSFHMPLFMMISGYFFYFSLQKHSFKRIVSIKTKQLLLPVLLFDTLYFFITSSFSGGLKDILVTYYATIIRTLWFLQALFFACMAVLLINTLFPKESIRLLLYAALCVSFVLLPDTFHSAGTKVMFPCFLAGLYFNKMNLGEKYKSIAKRAVIIIPLLLVYSALLYFFNVERTFYNSTVYIFSGIDSPAHLLFNDVYRVVIGIIGSLSVMAIVSEIVTIFKYPTWLGDFLSILGQNTLAFYCIHVYINDLWLHIYNPSLPGSSGYILLYILLMTAVCLLLSLAYRRVKHFFKTKRVSV